MMHGPFGKITPSVTVEQGGTGSTTEAEARARLGVPSLDGDNTFTGDNTFRGTTTFPNGSTVYFYHRFYFTDGSLLQEGVTVSRTWELPDADGTLLVDAPSDGKYYVRKDGAWVEIIP